MSDYDRATGIAPDSAPDRTSSRRRTSWFPGPITTSGPEANRGGQLPHQRQAAASEPIDGMPVRRAPVIQRVFIKRFVDENDMLQDDIVVYKEVKGAKWAGFEGPGAAGHKPGAYPHRTQGGATADTQHAPRLQTNLVQPDAPADDWAGSAMPPAGSGGVNAQKAER
jgi:hypothetical protein